MSPSIMFWLIALGMAGFVAVTVYTGEVRIRGRLWANRSARPHYFWLCVGAFTAGCFIAVAQAIYPSY